jgi:hypothetical protein
LFACISDQQYFKEMTDINTLRKLRQRTEEEMMEELLPFGFHDDGMPDENVIDVIPQGSNDLDDYDIRNFDPF